MRQRDLKKALNEHFVYEANALYYAAVKLHKLDKSTNKNNDEINMALESLILHGRNLFEFLYYDSNKSNYMRANHYISNETWKTIRPIKTALLSDFEERASKEMAHLTYDRIADDSKEKIWACSALFGELLSVIKIFLNNLPDEYKDNEINNLLTNLNKVAALE
jgi:hypothetical protein